MGLVLVDRSPSIMIEPDLQGFASSLLEQLLFCRGEFLLAESFSNQALIGIHFIEAVLERAVILTNCR